MKKKKSPAYLFPGIVMIAAGAFAFWAGYQARPGDDMQVLGYLAAYLLSVTGIGLLVLHTANACAVAAYQKDRLHTSGSLLRFRSFLRWAAVGVASIAALQWVSWNWLRLDLQFLPLAVVPCLIVAVAFMRQLRKALPAVMRFDGLEMPSPFIPQGVSKATFHVGLMAFDLCQVLLYRLRFETLSPTETARIRKVVDRLVRLARGELPPEVAPYVRMDGRRLCGKPRPMERRRHRVQRLPSASW